MENYTIYANMIGDVDNTQTCSTPANSDEIHSELQGNIEVYTLFDSCINPSHEDRVAYY